MLVYHMPYDLLDNGEVIARIASKSAIKIDCMDQWSVSLCCWCMCMHCSLFFDLVLNCDVEALLTVDLLGYLPPSFLTQPAFQMTYARGSWECREASRMQYCLELEHRRNALCCFCSTAQIHICLLRTDSRLLNTKVSFASLAVKYP